MGEPAYRQDQDPRALNGVSTRFQKGQSGNPSGRPKGIARQARDLINDDPQRLLNVLLEVAEDPKAKRLERVTAVNAYLDRAYGKAPAYAPVEGGDPLERDQLDERISAMVDELAPRRQGKGRSETPGGTVEAQEG